MKLEHRLAAFGIGAIASVVTAACSGGENEGAVPGPGAASEEAGVVRDLPPDAAGSVEEAPRFAPAEHRPWPQLVPPGGDGGAGHVLAPMTLVTILTANDTLASDLFAFSDASIASAWWHAVGDEYGVSAAEKSIHVTGAAIDHDLTGNGRERRPLPDAKAQAMAQLDTMLGTTLNAAAAGNGALVAAKTLITVKAAIAAAVVAGAIGLGGGYELGRAASTRGRESIAEPRVPIEEKAPPRVAPATPAARVAPAAAPAAEAAPADLCASVVAVAANKCSAPKPGKSVTFALKTRCSEAALDVFCRNERRTEPVALMRVDFDCKETGKPQMIAPGTTADVGRSEGHAFRVRDSSGVLLLDVVPTFLDTSTYLTVP